MLINCFHCSNSISHETRLRTCTSIADRDPEALEIEDYIHGHFFSRSSSVRALTAVSRRRGIENRAPTANCMDVREGGYGCVSLPKLDSCVPFSQGGEDCFARHTVMSRYRPQNCIERTYSKCVVIGNGYALVERVFGFENDVASGLMNLAIAPVTTMHRSQQLACNVPRQLHATDKISSRTR